MGEETIRVAIVHDWLVTIAGAEKVLIELLRLFPDADLFALVDFLDQKDRKKIFGKKAKTTFIQHLPFARRAFRNYLPLFPKAIESLDLRGYDLIISSSWAFAKGVKKEPHQKHICYCHTPIRYAWDLREEYLGHLSPIKRPVVDRVLESIRKWDRQRSNSIDRFIANSSCVKDRIARIYDQEAVVVHPPVDTQKFTLCRQKEEYYLTLSRLVPYKKTALIVEAFNQMPNRRLKVVGVGEEYERIKNMAKENVEVLGYKEDDEVVELMRKAKGFVYAALEDFGIVMAEALACGTPVIAYGVCGARDIVTPKSGIVFKRQDPKSIQLAIERFESQRFDHEKIRESALQFSQKNFLQKIDKIVHETL
ncbi:MAG: glycosyl transferase family 1 [Epsilonproteobacteria bacterium]|nr:glycosyl transferase family 1 [Campylobacterota bacterium]NPA64572.1 glycosyltransferase family 4 protein [Campylobacterota bacterium]